MARSEDKAVSLFPGRSPDRSRARPSVPRWAVVGIFVILAFGFLAEARAFLMPATLALLLFFVFVPFRRLLSRVGIGPSGAAVIVTFGLLLTVISLGYAISGPIGSLVQSSDQIGARLEERMQAIRENFRGIEEAAAKIDELADGDTKDGEDAPATRVTTNDAATTVVETSDGPAASATMTTTPAVPEPDGTVRTEQDIEVKVDATAGPTTMQQLVTLGPEIISQIVFTLVLLFFLLSSGDLMYLKIVQSFDSMKDKRHAYLALREIEDSLGRYLGSITIINLGLGVAIGLAMWAWGMPNPLLWGIAGFVLNYIPYIGAMLGTVTGAVVALLVYDDLWYPMMIGLTFLALTSLEGQFVTPLFVSNRLRLNQVVVFATVALWAWLWSVLGMVVAVPVLVVVRVLCEHIPGMEKLGNFLAGEAPPALEDEDEDSARDIVEAGDHAADSADATVLTAEAVEEPPDTSPVPRA
ncbi:AI-2E family transporter [uncultured Paracoccus sp.]|uniref:AI-2E family transporter n=1 Tax=uncultured Paracoccus sp. TaxID=189685 RepID=UPI00262409A8|nr:AI-2E family transporter [uncultured Paracoccus sp.]